VKGKYLIKLNIRLACKCEAITNNMNSAYQYCFARYIYPISKNSNMKGTHTIDTKVRREVYHVLSFTHLKSFISILWNIQDSLFLVHFDLGAIFFKIG
jgi:hypothetical protein